GARRVRGAAAAAVGRDRRGRARRTRGAVHGIPGVAAARGRSAGGVASAIRGARGRGPRAVVRVRGLPHGPSAAARGRQPRGGEPGRGAVPRGADPAVAGGGVGAYARHDARPGTGGGAYVDLLVALYQRWS